MWLKKLIELVLNCLSLITGPLIIFRRKAFTIQISEYCLNSSLVPKAFYDPPLSIPLVSSPTTFYFAVYASATLNA